MRFEALIKIICLLPLIPVFLTIKLAFLWAGAITHTVYTGLSKPPPRWANRQLP